MNFKDGFFGEGKITFEGGGIRVKTVRLDDIIPKDERIKIMKMDIEGSEYHALLGASDTLRRVDFVISECSEYYEDIQELLKKHGFNIKKLNFTSYILAYR